MSPFSNRLANVDVQNVRIDNVGSFELIDGEIVRCRRFDSEPPSRFTKWSKEEAELVSHVYGTVTPQIMAIECAWQGNVFKVLVKVRKRCWVLRRKDGTVYQIHPDYARDFAREKFQELLKKEG